MGTRIVSKQKIIFLVFFLVFLLLIVRHYQISPDTLADNLFYGVTDRISLVAGTYGLANICGEARDMVSVSGGYVCADTPRDEMEWGEIYYEYPLSSDGREVAYPLLEQGDVEKADKLLNNVVDFDRYDPVELSDPFTWEEDPFNERYWRFKFYSLRWLRHLLSEAERTRNAEYFQKVRSVARSFLEDGVNKEYAWDDAHGVAWRTMTLVDVWWTLREHNELPADLSDQILSSLVEHGRMLEDPEYYAQDNNHGITQIGALLVLSVNFPDLPQADEWNQLARERLDSSLTTLLDEDGVLVENSPYYHFYSLEKYWQIYNYSKEHDVAMSDRLETKMSQMVTHATYILQPDVSVPQQGASIERKINLAGVYEEIVRDDPHFLYVLTQGARGDVPPKQNISFPSSGHTVMRSGWGKGEVFENATYLLLDVGPYRTDHSDFDALTFSIFSRGYDLITEAGLYTYETDNPYFNYFHGTRGHNTVMVDGEIQSTGKPVAGELHEGEGWAYQSAWHQLYPGVTHVRAVALLGDHTVLVVDDLTSEDTHTYEQLFHFHPDIQDIHVDDLTVSGSVEGAPASVHVSQLEGGDVELEQYYDSEDPIAGYCAFAYEELTPCHQVNYVTRATSTRYVTLINLAGDEARHAYSSEDRRLSVKVGTDVYQVKVDEPLVSSDFTDATTTQTGGQITLSIENQTESWSTRLRGKIEQFLQF